MARMEKEARESEFLAQSKGSKIFGWVSLTIICVITIFPIYWMLRTGLSNTRLLFENTTSLLPSHFTTGGFQRALGTATLQQALAEGGSGASVNFGQAFLNSVLLSTGVTFFQTAFSAAAAYAFSVLQWKGRDKVFFVFIVALTVPSIFLLIPNFLFIRDLGLINTLAGIALPQLLMSPFAIFFLRQFFLGTNLSIVEAALIDGANHFKIFWRIVAPLAMPQIVTLGILQFIASWNDYLWPFYVGSGDPSSTVLTVALGVFKSQTPQGSPDWAGLMAGALIAAIPMVLLMIFFGRRIVGSVQASGVK